MLLDKTRKFIFIGVPRTGCRSVERWLKCNMKPMPVKLRGGFHRTRVPKPQEKRGWELIAGVRHPLDRLVSYYHEPTTQWDLKTVISLRRFAEVRRYLAAPTFDNFVQLIVARQYKKILPVVVFLRRVRAPMTHYIRFESMEADMEALPFVSQKVVLEPVGKSDRKPLVECYRDPETLEAALRWGEVDFFAYHYEPTLEAACALRGELCIR